MAEPSPAQPGGATTPPEPSPQPSENESGSSENTVTVPRDEWQKVHDGYHALSRKVGNLIERLDASPQPASQPNKQQPNGNADPEYDQRIKQLEERDKIVAQRERAAGIRNAISSSGVEGEPANILRSHIQQEMGDKIEVDQGTGEAFFRQDRYSDPVPLKAKIGELLKGDLGRFLRPGVSTPGDAGTRRGTGAAGSKPKRFSEYTQDELAKMSGPEQAKALMQGIRSE